MASERHKRAVVAGSTVYVQAERAESAKHAVRGSEGQMESATAAQKRLRARQQELQDELAQVQRQLEQLETMVVASQWRHAPSGPMGRGTVYHTGKDQRCRPSNRPEEITLYEALQTGLVPCRRCKPKSA